MTHEWIDERNIPVAQKVARRRPRFTFLPAFYNEPVAVVSGLVLQVRRRPVTEYKFRLTRQHVVQVREIMIYDPSK